METAYKKFQEFDWTDQRWQEYLRKLEPTPPLSNILKFKKKFYKQCIDSSFDTTYAPPAPASTPTPNYSRARTANQTRTPKLSAFNLKITFALLTIGIITAIASILPFFGSKIFYVSLLTMIGGLFLSIINDLGSIKPNKEYIRSVLSTENGWGILYSLTLLMTTKNALLLIPSVIYTALALSELYPSIEATLPPAVKEKTAQYANAVRNNRYALLELRSRTELYSFFLHLVLAILRRGSLISLLISFQYIRNRYASCSFLRSTFTQTHQFANSKLRAFPAVHGIYMKLANLVGRLDPTVAAPSASPLSGCSVM